MTVVCVFRSDNNNNICSDRVPTLTKSIRSFARFTCNWTSMRRIWSCVCQWKCLCQQSFFCCFDGDATATADAVWCCLWTCVCVYVRALLSMLTAIFTGTCMCAMFSLDFHGMRARHELWIAWCNIHHQHTHACVHIQREGRLKLERDTHNIMTIRNGDTHFRNFALDFPPQNKSHIGTLEMEK